MSDMLRITGLVSGMDTDATVKKLIEVEQLKVDKAEQEKQYLEWQKEDYREIASLLRGFEDEFFNVLKPTTRITGTSAFNMFTGTATSGGSASSAVSIKTSSSSIKGSFTINSVEQLATKDTWKSNGEVLGNVKSTSMDFTTDKTAYDANKQLSFTLDGVTKTITLDDGLTTNAEIAANIETKLDEVFTNVDFSITSTDSFDTMEFNILSKSGGAQETGHVFTVGSTNEALLTDLGLKEGQSNSVNTSKTLEDIFGTDKNQTVTINNKAFTFTKDTTVAEMMNEINTSDIGVTMTYDGFNDKFTLESNTAGTNSTLSVTDSVDSLFAELKLQDGNASNISAQNAIFTVNNVQTTRSSNDFTMNGTTVTLDEEFTVANSVTVNIGSDTAEVKDFIVGFVEKYNTMIKSINDKLGESKNYDYKPLTDAQKKEMSEDEIENWEAESRKGGLRNDTTLEKLTLQMRQALYESVDGLGISLSDIGIQTSSNYKDAGKLTIDSTKLDKALEERPNEIIELFTKESEVDYTSYEDRSIRYSENGIGRRLHDILKDNIRVTSDDDGNKGYLIEKAGSDTGVDTTSDLAKRIEKMDDKIADLLELLADKEARYYQEFSAMESAMSRYSSQSAWLTSQFGG